MIINIAIFLMLVFFILLLIFLAFSTLNPDRQIRLTIEWYKWILKVQGFDFRGEIKFTSKSRVICRLSNLFLLIVTAAYLALIIPEVIKRFGF